MGDFLLNAVVHVIIPLVFGFVLLEFLNLCKAALNVKKSAKSSSVKKRKNSKN